MGIGHRLGWHGMVGEGGVLFDQIGSCWINFSTALCRGTLKIVDSSSENPALGTRLKTDRIR